MAHKLEKVGPHLQRKCTCGFRTGMNTKGNDKWIKAQWWGHLGRMRKEELDAQISSDERARRKLAEGGYVTGVTAK